ncbi:alpha/beta hydrolase family esterase [Ruegeria sp.]|uniref:alpha/beta hydrolase family esterase n=1 Tax=Ruegeria sp. TaxID=1879320 RepID=UPI003B5A17B6
MIRRRGIRILSISVAALALVLAFKPERETDPLAHLKQDTECGGVGLPCKIADREYNVLIPKGTGPFPAVVFFHGSGGSGSQVIQNLNLVRPMLERGYAVIAPTALEIQYRNGPGTGWVWDTQRNERDDFGFVADMLGDALNRFSIEPTRIVTAGHSRGGSFSWYLACADVDDRLQAFAPIGGTLLREQPGACGSSPLDFDMFYSHGYSDTVIPFQGIGSWLGGSGYMGAIEIAIRFAHEAGCQADELIAAEGYDKRIMSDCPSGLSLSVIGYQGGHGIPVGWSNLMLDWFEEVTGSNPSSS